MEVHLDKGFTYEHKVGRMQSSLTIALDMSLIVSLFGDLHVYNFA